MLIPVLYLTDVAHGTRHVPWFRSARLKRGFPLDTSHVGLCPRPLETSAAESQSTSPSHTHEERATMIVNAVIVEQLEESGTLRSFRMRAAQSSSDLTVAFADEYDEKRSGPFHFLDDRDTERYADGFARCRARQLGDNYFRRNSSECHVETHWQGIPTERTYLTYYALSLPEFGIPQQLSVIDPHSSQEYRRTVTRDDQRNRYVVYLRCTSRCGSFDFQLSCDFLLDKARFSKSDYVDANTLPPGDLGNEWRTNLSKQQQLKVDDFMNGVAAALQQELSQLRQAMLQEPPTPEHEKAIRTVAAAEAAARNGDRSKALKQLRNAGHWTLDFATKIGASLATEAIKEAAGLR